MSFSSSHAVSQYIYSQLKFQRFQWPDTTCMSCSTLLATQSTFFLTFHSIQFHSTFHVLHATCTYYTYIHIHVLSHACTHGTFIAQAHPMIPVVVQIHFHMSSVELFRVVQTTCSALSIGRNKRQVTNTLTIVWTTLDIHSLFFSLFLLFSFSHSFIYLLLCSLSSNHFLKIKISHSHISTVSWLNSCVSVHSWRSTTNTFMISQIQLQLVFISTQILSLTMHTHYQFNSKCMYKLPSCLFCA